MRDAWLLPGALALHVAEEAPGFSVWARRHAWAGYRDRDFVVINAVGLGMTIGTTAAIGRRPSHRAWFAFYSAVVAQQTVWNPVFHIVTTLCWRQRSPGLLTALALFPPVWWRITRSSLRARLLTRRHIATGIAAGGVLHGMAVARQVFGVGRR
jgi:hypothetical protein